MYISEQNPSVHLTFRHLPAITKPEPPVPLRDGALNTKIRE